MAGGLPVRPTKPNPLNFGEGVIFTLCHYKTKQEDRPRGHPTRNCPKVCILRQSQSNTWFQSVLQYQNNVGDRQMGGANRFRDFIDTEKQ